MKSGETRGGKAREESAQKRHCDERAAESLNVARVRGAESDAAGEAFEIENLVEITANFLADDGSGFQFGDSVKARGDFFERNARAQNP